MHNALIIGCGNIGAGYDLGNDQVLTHAKALYHTKKFNLLFYDEDNLISEEFARQYHGVQITNIDDDVLDKCDWISLCTPTDTHYAYLDKLLQYKKKRVLCEKPISYDLQELETLIDRYDEKLHTVLVNYVRRFHPAYIRLKYLYSDLFDLDNLKECTIDYCRGFVNNASHAFDLMEFLFNHPIDLKNIDISNSEFDVFKNDPTVSLKAKWGPSDIDVRGHTGNTPFIFQIILRFESHTVEFTNSGQEITIYEGESSSTPLLHEQDCLKDYMTHVISYGMDTESLDWRSNFMSSLSLNKKLLTYLGHSN